MSISIENLIDGVKEAEDSTDACVFLIDTCFEDEPLSETQLAKLFDVFTEAELASYFLMYLHTVLDVLDLHRLQDLYLVVQEKFSDDSSDTLMHKTIRA